MLVIDLIIIAVTLGVAAWGFSRGVTVGAVALVGFGGGAILGSRVAPLLLDQGVRSTYAPILALPGALLFGGILAAVFELLSLRVGRDFHRLGPVDAIGGAVLAGCLGLVAAWLLGAVIAQVHSLRDPLAHSAILKRLNAVLPPLGPVLVADVAPVASIPTYEGPPPRVARPNSRVARYPGVQAAARSVVKVTQLGCESGGTGSGWVAAPGIVVTNAHVVAGADAITARLHTKKDSHDATPIWFDPKNDVALLRVPGLKGTATLPLASHTRAGTSAAILGFPGGRWDIRPARLGPTSTQVRGAVGGTDKFPRRRLTGILTTTFLGFGRPGNSGGPLVDTKGRVLTTLFGIGRLSGLGVPDATVRAALDRAGPPVETGTCESSD